MQYRPARLKERRESKSDSMTRPTVGAAGTAEPGIGPAVVPLHRTAPLTLPGSPFEWTCSDLQKTIDALPAAETLPIHYIDAHATRLCRNPTDRKSVV